MWGFLEVLQSSGHTLVAAARRNIGAKFPALMRDFEVLLQPLESSATLRCFLPPEPLLAVLDDREVSPRET